MVTDKVRVGVGVIIKSKDKRRIIVGKRLSSNGAGTWSLPGVNCYQFMY